VPREDVNLANRLHRRDNRDYYDLLLVSARRIQEVTTKVR
jgi:hypothetical protein